MKNFYTVIKETSSGTEILHHFSSYQKALHYIEFLCEGEIGYIKLPKRLSNGRPEYYIKEYTSTKVWENKLRSRKDLDGKKFGISPIGGHIFEVYQIKVQKLL